MVASQPWARTQTGVRGRLTNLRQPADALVFQYNPTSFSEQKDTQWAQAEVPGGDDSLDTFGSGQSLRIGMSLFFNVYGEGRNMEFSTTGVPLTRVYVEESLEFLYRFAETEGASRSPGILLLTLGALRFPGSFHQKKIDSAQQAFGGVRPRRAWFSLPVRIGSLKVDRQLFGKDWTTLRATADIDFVRVVGFPR